MISRNQELVDGFVDNIILGKTFDEVSKYIHEDITIDSVTGVKGSGYETSKKAVSIWKNAFEIKKNECLSREENGDEVTHCWKVAARHIGPFNGIEASNKEVSFTGTTTYKIRDNKIAAISGSSDFAA